MALLDLARAALGPILRLAVPVALALAILIPTFLALSNWWTGQNDTFRLSLVPRGLQVSRILDHAFAGDQTPLPSANGNGLIVYQLPAAVAQQIARGGIAEVQRMVGNQRKERFRIWEPTPFGSPSLSRDFGDVTIGDFLPHSWVPTQSPDLERNAADLLRQAGNFYSFDQGSRSLLTVAPSAGLVILAFSE